jgi:hypothetical protein
LLVLLISIQLSAGLFPAVFPGAISGPALLFFEQNAHLLNRYLMEIAARDIIVLKDAAPFQLKANLKSETGVARLPGTA